MSWDLRMSMFYSIFVWYYYLEWDQFILYSVAFVGSLQGKRGRNYSLKRGLLPIKPGVSDISYRVMDALQILMSELGRADVRSLSKNKVFYDMLCHVMC